jgi:uncharacterized membrane protein
MSAFIVDWLNLLIRWAHLIVGIGWIGTSFYFIALDLSLRKREGMREGVAGTAWEVHGGGFYQVEKYLLAPKDLPPDLIWYKWEAYLTWVTGFLLLAVQYYWYADSYLIDPTVMYLLPAQAIVLSVGSLILGWLIYDYLCKSRIGRDPMWLAVAVFLLIIVFAWFFSKVFSGRGALIHVGAFVGTIMAVNVFGVIIPNQKKIVAALMEHKAPDRRLGAVGKQRSVHNNYLTLPVLAMMVSGHYPMLTSHPQSWLVVALIIVIGASVRHFLNRHDAGEPLYKIAWALPVATVALGAALYATAPRSAASFTDVQVTDDDVFRIVGSHCVMCHTQFPSREGFDAPPKGVVLGTLDEVLRHKDAVLAQAVFGNAMPLGNENGMTEAERNQLGAWLLRH